MPRSRASSTSSRGGGMFGSSAPTRSAAPAHHTPAAPAPAPVAHAPPPPAPQVVHVAPAPASGGGILSGIVQGMAFGTGSAIAHRAVGAMFSGGDDKKEAAPAPAPAPAPVASAAGGAGGSLFGGRQDCAPFQRDFTKCLTENKSDIASCQIYMDSFNQCVADNKLA